ncbi:putative transcriptional regulatory protein [Colletotrichum orbiculare MAFF 240422]|uniref:Transcriptional regulatory protein n=1 Tax=Colletotrichum orbiculare (strain 104-T / ATCC 96160 / CBS 514.97 / LARS 414 / MAFF 240422) TaxID=1213857 RepID=N4VUK9_COLOR|nr:putative transcriptional regulatory protein [Colletotrichum orbiculare MAFF 240422]
MQESIEVDMGVGESRDNSPPARHKLSCDSCRIRKVGCDRQSPCTRCQRMNTKCTYALGYKPRPKKERRPGPVGQLEDKIDDIAEKLQALCVMFERSNAAQVGQVDGYNSLDCHDVSSPRSLGRKNDVEYGGFTAAPRLKKTVSSNSTTSSDHEPTSTVRNGSGLASPRRAVRRSSPSAHDINSWPLPSIEYTLDCLRMARENSLLRFFWMTQFESIGHVNEQLLGVYSLNRPPSNAELVITFVGLHWLFSQCSQMAGDRETEASYSAEAERCRESVDAVLAQLPLHLPTNINYILALSMATEYCMSQGNATLAWTYISTASRMSQALGLHRLASQTGNEFDLNVRRKTKLFWSVFVLEKNLSLQLGQSSTLRDHDIAVPLKHIRTGHHVGGSLCIISPRCLRVSHIEGRVYDDIYSPESLLHSPLVRNSRARMLISELKTIVDDTSSAEVEFLHDRRRLLGDRVDDLLTCCEKACSFSLMCLVYRSTSANAGYFSRDTVATAREAIAEHIRCMDLVGSRDALLFNKCITWSLVSSTCVPFFVTLGHAIQTASDVDLSLLGSLVRSWEANCGCSTSAARLLKMFKPIYVAACRYMELGSHPCPDVGNISLETIYRETISRADASQWFDLSASLKLLVPPEPVVLGDGTEFRSDCDTANGHFGNMGALADPSSDAARLHASDLGDWFMHSRYMYLMDGVGEGQRY